MSDFKEEKENSFIKQKLFAESYIITVRLSLCHDINILGKLVLQKS